MTTEAFAATSPDQCRDLAEVRSGVDEIDARIISLLQRRWAYTLKAAAFKPARDRVRDETRIAAQVQGAVVRGEAAGLPPDFVARFWTSMIDLHVEYEVKEFDRLSAAG